MPLFVQQHNGKVHRIRGTLGGSKAWKQHEGCSGPTDHGERSRLMEKIEDALAREQMRDAIVGTHSDRPDQHRGNRRHKQSADRQRHNCHHTATPQAPVVAQTSKPAPRFQVVISASGTMRAEFFS